MQASLKECGCLERHLRGNVSVNVDYSFLTMHLNILGLFFFSQMYIRMYVLPIEKLAIHPFVDTSQFQLTEHGQRGQSGWRVL